MEITLNFWTILIVLALAAGLVYFGIILGQRSKTARGAAGRIRSYSDEFVDDLRRQLREAQAKLREDGREP